MAHTPPSAAQQRSFMETSYNPETPPQDGEQWFPINAEWLDQLLSFVNDKAAADGSAATAPGAIDNSMLAEEGIPVALKRGLVSAVISVTVFVNF
jgi:hypothetical protein